MNEKAEIITLEAHDQYEINMNIIHMQYNRASRNNMDDKDDKHNKYVMIINIYVTTLINLKLDLGALLGVWCL